MRTQVGIIGAGPAGLFLAHLLHRAGIESVVLEARLRRQVEETVRAGVLEHWVADLMRDLGIGERMEREAHFHDGISLQWDGQRHHLDIRELSGGKRVTVYPQHEVLKDLIAGWLAQGGDIRFGATVTEITGLDTSLPRIEARLEDGSAERIECDYVVGADGFHGPSRQAIPPNARTEFQKSTRSAGSAS